jgi:hypothetical protein
MTTIYFFSALSFELNVWDQFSKIKLSFRIVFHVYSFPIFISSNFISYIFLVLFRILLRFFSDPIFDLFCLFDEWINSTISLEPLSILYSQITLGFHCSLVTVSSSPKMSKSGLRPTSLHNFPIILLTLWTFLFESSHFFSYLPSHMLWNNIFSEHSFWYELLCVFTKGERGTERNSEGRVW